METLLIIAVTLGIVCAFIAHSKGRLAIGWFFAGFGMTFLFVIPGIIMLIVCCVMSNLKAEKAYKEYTERENRRLREQLRQEQIKSETFRQYATQRIDSHDQALGVDTRHANPTALPGQAQTMMLEQNDSDALTVLAGGNQQPIQTADVPPLPAAAPPPLQATMPKPPRQWFYELNGASMGPVSTEAIKTLIQQRQIASDTLVWTDSLTEWTPARRISIFKPLMATA